MWETEVSSSIPVKAPLSRGGAPTGTFLLTELTVSLQYLGKTWNTSSWDTFLGTQGRKTCLGMVRFAKGESCPTHLIAFCDKLTGLMDEGHQWTTFS